MKTFAPESLLDLVSLSDVHVSPDGRLAVFVRSSLDGKANATMRQIWLKRLDDDSPAFQASAGPKDAHPRWLPDGSAVAFISGRTEKPQVHILPIALPGEARAITQIKTGVVSFELARDGRSLACLSSLHARDRGIEDAPDQPPPAEIDLTDPRVITRVPMRSGTTYSEDRFRHVYVCDIPAAGATLTPARRITDGDASYSQPQSFGDGWISANHRDPASGDLFNGLDLVLLHDDNTRAVRRFNLPGYTLPQARPSPDGRWLAAIAVREDGLTARMAFLVLFSVRDGMPVMPPVHLSQTIDRNPGNFGWRADSCMLYFTIADSGSVNLYRVSIDGNSVGKPEAITKREQYLQTNDESSAAFALTPDEAIVFVSTTHDGFNQLQRRKVDASIETLYAPNKLLIDTHMVARSERVSYLSDGVPIEGWLLYPPEFDRQRRYPLIINIHGGPHVMWGPGMESMWLEHQAMAAAGYLVFYCNPRGSDGYGEAFWHADNANWAGAPMRDVLNGLDTVIARGGVDTTRLCVTGGSYGGYLTALIVATSDRFAAACAQRGVYNLLSIRNNSDIPYFFDREQGMRNPWNSTQWLWDQSPIAHVDRITIPLLIEHSENDYRVPIEQAEQLYHALKLQRKTVELVRWPREGHELSRAGEPKHRVDRITRIIAWFNRHAPAS